MAIKVDNELKDLYKYYFSDLSSNFILEKINKIFKANETELLIDTINIVKACAVMNYTFSQTYTEIVRNISNKFPIEKDINEFIVSIVIKIMIASNSVEVEQLLKPIRDIRKEVASKLFRVSNDKVTNEMLNSVDNINSSYTIEEPPVKDWDRYFFDMAINAARNSKCLSRRIGAVLVHDKSIISTGYNGPPRGVPRCDLRWQLDPLFFEEFNKTLDDDLSLESKCPRKVLNFKSGEGVSLCPAGHAERNALINAAREGICTRDAILYLTCGVPCGQCMVEIINAGVREIVVTSLNLYDKTALYLLQQSEVQIRLYDFLLNPPEKN